MSSVSFSVMSNSLWPHGVPDFSIHGILQQECWSGLPFPSLGDLPDPGIEPQSQHWRQILYCLSHQEMSRIWVSYSLMWERTKFSILLWLYLNLMLWICKHKRDANKSPCSFHSVFFLCVSFWTVSVAMFWNILMVSLAMSNLVMCFLHQAMQFSSLFFFVSFICLSNKINLSSNFWNVWNTGMLVSWPWGSWQ